MERKTLTQRETKMLIYRMYSIDGYDIPTLMSIFNKPEQHIRSAIVSSAKIYYKFVWKPWRVFGDQSSEIYEECADYFLGEAYQALRSYGYQPYNVNLDLWKFNNLILHPDTQVDARYHNSILEFDKNYEDYKNRYKEETTRLNYIMTYGTGIISENAISSRNIDMIQRACDTKYNQVMNIYEALKPCSIEFNHFHTMVYGIAIAGLWHGVNLSAPKGIIDRKKFSGYMRLQNVARMLKNHINMEAAAQELSSAPYVIIGKSIMSDLPEKSRSILTSGEIFKIESNYEIFKHFKIFTGVGSQAIAKIIWYKNNRDKIIDLMNDHNVHLHLITEKYGALFQNIDNQEGIDALNAELEKDIGTGVIITDGVLKITNSNLLEED